MKPRKPLVMPQFGVIKGGRLDGWAFHFLHFRVVGIQQDDRHETVSWELRVVARCTPPAWPFPHDIALDGSHFMQMRAVPGSRAKRLKADGLVRSAYELEGLSPPGFLTGDKNVTLRAAVKRCVFKRSTR